MNAFCRQQKGRLDLLKQFASPIFQSSGFCLVLLRDILDENDFIPSSEKGRKLRSSKSSDMRIRNNYTTKGTVLWLVNLSSADQLQIC